MNETLLLVRDKSMPEMYLREPGFTYIARGTLTKSKQQIQKCKEKEDSRYIYQNKLDKACFQHAIDYGDFNGSW